MIKINKTYGKYNEKDIYSMADPPKNEEETNDYANALYSSGYYPAGLDGCFTVGISGGCGLDCWVYQEGKCKNAGEFEDELQDKDDIDLHNELYKTNIKYK
jgi:hypothetical protein